jgi:hypothetical protein
MLVPEMQRHYAEWETAQSPEIRHVTQTSPEQFDPFEPSPHPLSFSQTALPVRGTP